MKRINIIYSKMQQIRCVIDILSLVHHDVANISEDI